MVVLGGVGWCWVVLGGVGWCWVVLGSVGWCWVVLVWWCWYGGVGMVVLKSVIDVQMLRWFESLPPLF